MSRALQGVDDLGRHVFLVMLGEHFARVEDAIVGADRKSTRLNSSHLVISYAVFCLKKKIGARRRRRQPARKEALRSASHYFGTTPAFAQATPKVFAIGRLVSPRSSLRCKYVCSRPR